MLARPILFVALGLWLLPADDAHAGRRSLRVDVGAWYPSVPVIPYQGIATEACPGAGVNGSLVNEPLYQQGFVGWNSIWFQAAATDGLVLSEFYCQHSRPYQALADPSEYLNATVFPADEQGLAGMVGGNTDGAVSAIRYSFLQADPNGEFNRQWAFYFFPDGLTVVALYGVPTGDSVYPSEMIFDNQSPYETFWSSTRDGFTGQYFCFQGRSYIGDCVPPEPPPPEQILVDGFEAE